MNILIVDDENEQLDSLRVGLGINGFKVIEALNAKEALQYINNHSVKIDIVLTDYAMQGMDGMELLKKIRQKNKFLPVVMMTAYGEKNIAIDALRNRCDSFIEKPFTLDQLLQEIDRASTFMPQNANSSHIAEKIPMFIHQINNPLMSIIGSAELSMMELGENASVKHYLQGIIEATEKIKTINAEILKLHQPTKGKIERFDLRIVLDDCLRSFNDLMLFKNISLENHIREDGFFVSGNKFSLDQAFKNLILNAIDSMDKSEEKRLRMKVEVDEHSPTVLVHIEDTGCGIPEESLNKIFTPYYTSKHGGTGLGLPVVMRVMEKISGEIYVESKVGKGTTFTVSLPIDDRRLKKEAPLLGNDGRIDMPQ